MQRFSALWIGFIRFHAMKYVAGLPSTGRRRLFAVTGSGFLNS